jgi:hypothetical protein
MLQAIRRAHRFGQEKTVHIHRFVSTLPLEDCQSTVNLHSLRSTQSMSTSFNVAKELSHSQYGKSLPRRRPFCIQVRNSELAKVKPNSCITRAGLHLRPRHGSKTTLLRLESWKTIRRKCSYRAVTRLLMKISMELMLLVELAFCRTNCFESDCTIHAAIHRGKSVT